LKELLLVVLGHPLDVLENLYGLLACPVKQELPIFIEVAIVLI
jgi:hypothetical protein